MLLWIFGLFVSIPIDGSLGHHFSSHVLRDGCQKQHGRQEETGPSVRNANRLDGDLASVQRLNFITNNRLLVNLSLSQSEFFADFSRPSAAETGGHHAPGPDSQTHHLARASRTGTKTKTPAGQAGGGVKVSSIYGADLFTGLSSYQFIQLPGRPTGQSAVGQLKNALTGWLSVGPVAVRILSGRCRQRPSCIHPASVSGQGWPTAPPPASRPEAIHPPSLPYPRQPAP